MDLIYHKTEKGMAALKTRGKGLPQKLRTMLILIDGTKSVRELLPAAAILGMEGDALAMLVQQGLIQSGPEGIFAAPAPAPGMAGQDAEFARFRSALAFMTETVADALGVRAFFFMLKIEKCSTRADLALLVDDYAKAIEKGSGREASQALTARMRELLK